MEQAEWAGMDLFWESYQPACFILIWQLYCECVQAQISVTSQALEGCGEQMNLLRKKEIPLYKDEQTKR